MDKIRKILYEMILASKSEREQIVYYNTNKQKIIQILLELKAQLDDKKQI